VSNLVRVGNKEIFALKFMVKFLFVYLLIVFCVSVLLLFWEFGIYILAIIRCYDPLSTHLQLGLSRSLMGIKFFDFVGCGENSNVNNDLLDFHRFDGWNGLKL
jgi:hypothetical protein